MISGVISVEDSRKFGARSHPYIGVGRGLTRLLHDGETVPSSYLYNLQKVTWPYHELKFRFWLCVSFYNKKKAMHKRVTVIEKEKEILMSAGTNGHPIYCSRTTTPIPASFWGEHRYPPSGSAAIGSTTPSGGACSFLCQLTRPAS